MPGLPQVPSDVRTVHLGEFSWENADLIAEQLAEARDLADAVLGDPSTS